mmetsp:Transcript_98972/g.308425  ORF Transcript_98972/g.308425 Transcript_98972/m.308425 type:complete len:206 (-) Transcript_98972:319-936(-)
MNAAAALSARWTSAASSPERPAVGAPCRSLGGERCPAAGAESPSAAASKPLRRTKSSRERVTRAASFSCSAGQGSSRELTASKDSHESFSLLKIAPPPTVLSGALVLCLDSTTMAAFKFSMAWILSISLPWNSFCCFSRRAVASPREALFAATSSSVSRMVVFRPAIFAVSPSMEAPSSEILASDEEMDSSFSYSLLLHQHASLS